MKSGVTRNELMFVVAMIGILYAVAILARQDYVCGEIGECERIQTTPAVRENTGSLYVVEYPGPGIKCIYPRSDRSATNCWPIEEDAPRSE